MPPARVAGSIRSILPARLRPGWSTIQRRPSSTTDDAAAIPTARWVATEGAVHGFRPPNTTERARGLGMEAYARGLLLEDDVLFTAQGSALDRAALGARCGQAIASWVQGRPVPSVTFPSPARVNDIYSRTFATLAAASDDISPRAVTSPFPPAIAAFLFPGSTTPSNPTPLAAEHGRGAR